MEEVQDKLQAIVRGNIERNTILGKHIKDKDIC